MSLQDLTQSIDAILNTQSVIDAIQEDERRHVLEACETLRARLESPFEKSLRLLFTTHQAMALRLAVDMGIFDAVATPDNEVRQISLSELATKTEVDELLLLRVMRMLVGMKFFEEPSERSYVPYPIVSAYTSSSPLSAVTIHMSHSYTVLSQLPEYFSEVGWKNPGDVYNGPFQYAMGTKEHYFDFLSSKPYYQQAFNAVMTLSHRRRGKNWFTFFPVEEKLQAKGPMEVLLVDIGGSQGADIKTFHKAYPALTGQLVLQDLPSVIEGCKDLPARIKALGHDFFDEQPVKGARAYFLRAVLHDWPDKQALQILKRIREAMDKDSLLLINETILPAHQVPLSSAQVDLAMMISFASLERTEKQFAQLLEEAGFELVRVWAPEGVTATLGEDSTLIEARIR